MTTPPTHLGRYQLLDVLGQGSFATVYRGRDPRLGRDVAIKVLSDQLAADADDRRRFLAEARALATLHHPHIVTAYDVGEENVRPYFVMELVEGETLASMLRRAGGKWLPFSRVLQIVRELASAVDYLHGQRLIHRDIKAANVVLMPSGSVKLMDFGIALVRGAARLTQGPYGLGTPEYASPEQIKGIDIGPGTDVYALGILTFELLAGRPPYTGDMLHVLHAHGYEQPPPLAGFRPDLPAHVETAIRAAIAKSPADRPRSASAFVSILVGLRTSPLKPGMASADTASGTTSGGTQASAAPRPEPPPAIGPGGPPPAVSVPPLSQPPQTAIPAQPVALGASSRVERTVARGVIAGSVLPAGIAIVTGIASIGIPIATGLLLLGAAALGIRYRYLPGVRQKREVTAQLAKLRRERKMRVRTIDQMERRLHEIPAGIDAEIARAVAGVQRNHVGAQLQRATINAARIPGIGPALKGSLKAWGIYTAADVSGRRARRVPGIGPNKAASLVAWRNSVAGNALRSRPTKLPDAQTQQIRARFDGERKEIEGRLPTARAWISPLDQRIEATTAALGQYAGVTMNAYLKQLLRG